MEAKLNFSKFKENWRRLSSALTPSRNSEPSSLREDSDVTVTETLDEASLVDIEFENAIGDLLKDNEVLVNGKISAMKLGRIREKMGSKWPKYSSFIQKFAQKVIEKRLGPRDVYHQVGEEAFVFVFDDLTEEEAIIKCSLIAKEIGEQVVGSDWSAEEYGATVCVSKTDGKPLLENKSMRDSILESLAQAQMHNPSSILLQSDPDVAERTMLRMRDKMEALEKIEYATNDEDEEALKNFREIMTGICSVETRYNDTKELIDLNSNSPKWEVFHHQNQEEQTPKMDTLSLRLSSLINDTESMYTVLQDKLMEQFDEEEPEPEEADDSEQEGEELDMVLSYWPILQPPPKRVSAYRLEAEFMLENSLWSIDDLPEDLQPTSIAALDQLVLRRAIVDLVDCIRQDIINAIIIPVNFSTLNTASYRKSYIEICATIPKQFHKFLAWEIINSGVQNWHSQLLNAVSAVRRYGRLVGLNVDVSNPSFTDLKAIGVDIVGYHYKHAVMSDEELSHKLKNFKKRADAEGLKTHLFGIPSKQVFDIAVKAGFDYLNGEYVGQRQDYPSGIYSFDKEIPSLNVLT